jgi:mRNA-degrading endonuclease RelE of RelBE toxin-antitoxin system
MKRSSRVVFNEYGLESLLALPSSVQKQALKKARGIIGASPDEAGYPLKRELAGFRGIHAGRYRIIWRVLTLESGETVADISYVGIRAADDSRDAYTEAQRVLERLDWS